MRLFRSLTLACFLAIGAAACGPASTPVTPAPASEQELTQIKQRLPGTWVTKQIAKSGKPPEDIGSDDIDFTFTADGKLHLHLGTGLGAFDFDYAYKLDGKNITSDSPSYPTLRIDELTDTTAKLFNYSRSETHLLVRK